MLVVATDAAAAAERLRFRDLALPPPSLGTILIAFFTIAWGMGRTTRRSILPEESEQAQARRTMYRNTYGT